jgi:Flp pilus assembly protein TadD
VAACLFVGLLLALTLLVLPRTDAWREGEFSRRTLPALEALARERGDDPVLLYWLGRRLSEAGRHRDAATVLESAVARDPLSARVRDAWAEALLATGNAPVAFSQLKQFVALKPGDANARLMLGKLHATLGADSLAEPEIREALRLRPDLAEAWSLLGDIQYRAAREEEAVTSLRRAVELAPTRAADHATLGRILAGRDPDAAGRAFDRAVALVPADPSFLSDRAAFHARYGRYERAEADAREAARLAPEDADARLTLGRSLLERGATGEARAPLERAAELAPFDPRPAQLLRRLCERSGDRAGAATWGKRYDERQAVADAGRRLRDGLLKTPTDRGLHRKMARHQARLGKAEECARHLAFALSAPLDAALLRAVADEFRAVGRVEQAEVIEKQIPGGDSQP